MDGALVDGELRDRLPARTPSTRRTGPVAGGSAAGRCPGPGIDSADELRCAVSNSISGWTVVAATIVRLAHATPVRSAVFGAVSSVALTVGYATAAATRGLTTTPRPT